VNKRFAARAMQRMSAAAQSLSQRADGLAEQPRDRRSADSMETQAHALL
jgi:hypothetical protein